MKPTIIGLVAAAAFALSAIGFRGAIITVPGVSFVTAASYTLVFGLFVQTLVLSIYLRGAGTRCAQGHPRPVEAVDAGGLHRRVRLAILVSGVCTDRRGECTHAGAGRGAVRAGGGVLLVQAAAVGARDLFGHRA